MRSGLRLGRLDPLTTLLLWLGPINLILGIFNLVPVMLDGHVTGMVRRRDIVRWLQLQSGAVAG